MEVFLMHMKNDMLHLCIDFSIAKIIIGSIEKKGKEKFTL
jgi:hypothetical protein